MRSLESYKETSVLTQNKGKLIVMLYEGAIKFLKMATEEIKAKNPEAKGEYISKAQDIINELNAVLDMEAGGEIAINLRKLYCFMNRHLSQANVKQDVTKIEEVIKLLEDINQSWKIITE